MRGLVRTRCAALLALVGLVAGGCDSSSESSSSRGVVENDFETSLAFLEQLPDAHSTTRYRGERRIEQHFGTTAAPQVLVYTELVGADGAGNFALELLEVSSGVLDVDLLGVEYNARQRFHHRYRDVRIHHLTLALDNYKLRVLDDSAQVLGLECIELGARPLSGRGSTYRLWVDPNTGLTLRSEEHTQRGALVRRMDFESIELDPDLSDLQLSDHRVSRIPGNGGGNAPEPDFELLEPTLPPTGYTLVETTFVVDVDGTTWARIEYSDGIEQVFLLHQERVDSGLPGGAAAGKVDSMVHGPWNVLIGDVNGWELMLLGKVPVDDLAQMLQSAL